MFNYFNLRKKIIFLQFFFTISFNHPCFLNIQIIPSSSGAESLYFYGRLVFWKRKKNYKEKTCWLFHDSPHLSLFHGFYLRIYGNEYVLSQTIVDNMGYVTDYCHYNRLHDDTKTWFEMYRHHLHCWCPWARHRTAAAVEGRDIVTAGIYFWL